MRETHHFPVFPTAGAAGQGLRGRASRSRPQTRYAAAYPHCAAAQAFRFARCAAGALQQLCNLCTTAHVFAAERAGSQSKFEVFSQRSASAAFSADPSAPWSCACGKPRGEPRITRARELWLARQSRCQPLFSPVWSRSAACGPPALTAQPNHHFDRNLGCSCAYVLRSWAV